MEGPTVPAVDSGNHNDLAWLPNVQNYKTLKKEGSGINDLIMLDWISFEIMSHMSCCMYCLVSCHVVNHVMLIIMSYEMSCWVA